MRVRPNSRNFTHAAPTVPPIPSSAFAIEKLCRLSSSHASITDIKAVLPSLSLAFTSAPWSNSSRIAPSSCACSRARRWLVSSQSAVATLRHGKAQVRTLEPFCPRCRGHLRPHRRLGGSDQFCVIGGNTILRTPPIVVKPSVNCPLRSPGSSGRGSSRRASREIRAQRCS